MSIRDDLVGGTLFADVAYLACTSGAFQVGGLAVKTQKIWLEAVQTQVAATASALNLIREVKMMGLSDYISSDLQNRRVVELAKSKGYRNITTMQNTISTYGSSNK
jgi:ATP-binding cassette subfamily C (CFTR/MRP) protein 1